MVIVLLCDAAPKVGSMTRYVPLSKEAQLGAGPEGGGGGGSELSPPPQAARVAQTAAGVNRVARMLFRDWPIFDLLRKGLRSVRPGTARTKLKRRSGAGHHSSEWRRLEITRWPAREAQNWRSQRTSRRRFGAE